MNKLTKSERLLFWAFHEHNRNLTATAVDFALPVRTVQAMLATIERKLLADAMHSCIARPALEPVAAPELEAMAA